MGIQGLHKGLNFATRKTSLRDFQGQTLAVDSSSWLHRSVYSVSEKYVEAMEQGRLDPHCVRASAKYVTARCHELLGPFQIGKIFLVMDGKRCPLKTVTNEERERKRQENLAEAREYKRRGQRDKAEEKYKSCIKIKDELTVAVMRIVKQNFQNDDRVQFVWSPYEADAQLAKLCLDRVAHAVITEVSGILHIMCVVGLLLLFILIIQLSPIVVQDSDVLVYSASSQCAFPVIFKLDRHSGRCDVTSMEWLLSYKENQLPTGKQGSALETLLNNLGSREARKPGFGVRLFVQGCVLAGCDYAPNNLPGVGLVNAFKFIRDSAFRKNAVRFAKVLDAMPGRHRLNIDLQEYELNLARSEAIFFYHLVLHTDGSIAPLCEIREHDPSESDSSSDPSRHFPSMERFNGDWSFLGEMKRTVHTPTTPKAEPPPPISEIIIQDPNSPSKRKSNLPAMFATRRKKADSTRNPYLNSRSKITPKRPRETERMDSDPTSQSDAPLACEQNPFSKFARIGDPKNGLGSSFLKDQDPRFVKRHFSKEAIPASTTRRAPRWNRSENKHSEPEIQVATYYPTDFPQVGDTHILAFDYGGSDDIHDPDTPYQPSSDVATESISDQLTYAERQTPPFFDLTDSNSAPIGIEGEDVDDGAFRNSKLARVSLDSTLGGDQPVVDLDDDVENTNPSVNIRLPEPPNEDQQFECANTSTSVDCKSRETRSRYFPAKKRTICETSDRLGGEKSKGVDRTFFEECTARVQSPVRGGILFETPASFPDIDSKRVPMEKTRPASIGITTRRRGPLGPLLSAFGMTAKSPGKQTVSKGRPWVRNFRPLQSKTKRISSTNTLRSYFTPLKSPRSAGSTTR